jgi:hypothetical protein
MEMRFGRQALAFAGQSRPAPGAKSPPHAGRRIELGYLTFSDDISGALECREDGDGRTAVFPTTLAMAPCQPIRFTNGHEAHRTAQAATLELITYAMELGAS